MADPLATESAHRKPLPPGPLTLVIVCGASVRRTALARPALIRIGRDATSDVVVDDSQVSRFHAEIQLNNRVCVRDLGSSNGTRLRGVELRPHDAFEVFRGETIEVGGTVLLLHPSDEDAVLKVQALLARSSSSPMRAVRHLCDQASSTDRNVLLLGETGTGKATLARRIHEQSARREQPLVVLDGASLDRDAVAALLDDPNSSVRRGVGSLLLRRIDALPFDVQQRLAALADSNPRVRLMATTSHGPAELVASGRLRRELRFRVEQLLINVPPLRARVDELAELFIEAITNASHARGLEQPPPVDPTLLETVAGYPWPGNLRELSNRASQAMLVHDDGPLLPRHLLLTSLEPVATPAEDPERARIMQALAECAGNQSHAAKLLGISRRTLSTRLDKYGIPRPRKRAR